MQLICLLLRIYEIVLLARILMSWINPDPDHPVVIWMHRLTDPVLEPVRKMIPLNAMGIDFSPIIVFILLSILQQFFGCHLYSSF